MRLSTYPVWFDTHHHNTQPNPDRSPSGPAESLHPAKGSTFQHIRNSYDDGGGGGGGDDEDDDDDDDDERKKKEKKSFRQFNQGLSTKDSQESTRLRPISEQGTEQQDLVRESLGPHSQTLQSYLHRFQQVVGEI
ncbi:hypothetical protein E2C01_034572 [Portunus trituberculatus]|uniref:Uncharacterized protein n=1 Tax=Portunus trituberculatus TaxID=210409 RepID=A0A5B7F7E0_PORTR|nr:hypothetical protein [Portunus trituberculatus]